MLTQFIDACITSEVMKKVTEQLPLYSKNLGGGCFSACIQLQNFNTIPCCERLGVSFTTEIVMVL